MTDLKKVPNNIEITLTLSEQSYSSLIKHLLPEKSKIEECAFLFVDFKNGENKIEFAFKDSYYLSENDYISHSGYHLELKDSVRADIIKKAHDLGCCIVETHSHIKQRVAELSYSDWIGFSEFVPHVLWRLNGKPYIALVFTTKNFDALVWFKGLKSPITIKEIKIGGRLNVPTRKSINKQYNEE